MSKFQVVEGQFNAAGHRYAIVASRFNELIVSKLLAGCVDVLVRHGAEEEQQSVFWVPGAMEIPLLAKKLAARKEFDGVICLGTVIRGGTPHFDMVAGEVTKGVAHVALESEKPVIFGVLTTDTIEQAIERAGTKMGNKGWDAGLSAIEMVNLLKSI